MKTEKLAPSLHQKALKGWLRARLTKSRCATVATVTQPPVEWNRVTRVEVAAGAGRAGSEPRPVPEGVAGLTLGRLHTGFLTHLEKSVQKTYGQVVVLQVVK